MYKKEKQKRKTYSLKRRRRITTNLSLIPTAIILLITFVLPLSIALVISLRNYNLNFGTNEFVYFKNYIKAFTDNGFLQSIGRNIIYVVITVGANFVIGFTMALVVNRKFRGSNILNAIFILPMVLMPVSAAVLWRFIYDQTFGIANHILQLFGISGHAWLGSLNTSLYAVIVTDIWAWTPFMFLILLAGLKSLPRDPYEAAIIDGASEWELFKSITLPLMKPVILIALTIKSIDTFKAFDYLWVMTKGGPADTSHITSTYIYRYGFGLLDFGYGSAMTVIVFLIIILFSGVYVSIINKQENVR